MAHKLKSALADARAKTIKPVLIAADDHSSNHADATPDETIDQIIEGIDAVPLEKQPALGIAIEGAWKLKAPTGTTDITESVVDFLDRMKVLRGDSDGLTRSIEAHDLRACILQFANMLSVLVDEDTIESIFRNNAEHDKAFGSCEPIPGPEECIHSLMTPQFCYDAMTAHHLAGVKSTGDIEGLTSMKCSEFEGVTLTKHWASSGKGESDCCTVTTPLGVISTVLADNTSPIYLLPPGEHVTLSGLFKVDDSFRILARAGYDIDANGNVVLPASSVLPKWVAYRWTPGSVPHDTIYIPPTVRPTSKGYDASLIERAKACGWEAAAIELCDRQAMLMLAAGTVRSHSEPGGRAARKHVKLSRSPESEADYIATGIQMDPYKYFLSACLNPHQSPGSQFAIQNAFYMWAGVSFTHLKEFMQVGASSVKAMWSSFASFLAASSSCIMVTSHFMACVVARHSGTGPRRRTPLDIEAKQSLADIFRSRRRKSLQTFVRTTYKATDIPDARKTKAYMEACRAEALLPFRDAASGQSLCPGGTREGGKRVLPCAKNVAILGHGLTSVATNDYSVYPESMRKRVFWAYAAPILHPNLLKKIKPIGDISGPLFSLMHIHVAYNKTTINNRVNYDPCVRPWSVGDGPGDVVGLTYNSLIKGHSKAALASACRELERDKVAASWGSGCAAILKLYQDIGVISELGAEFVEYIVRDAYKATSLVACFDKYHSATSLIGQFERESANRGYIWAEFCTSMSKNPSTYVEQAKGLIHIPDQNDPYIQVVKSELAKLPPFEEVNDFTRSYVNGDRSSGGHTKVHVEYDPPLKIGERLNRSGRDGKGRKVAAGGEVTVGSFTTNKKVAVSPLLFMPDTRAAWRKMVTAAATERRPIHVATRVDIAKRPREISAVSIIVLAMEYMVYKSMVRYSEDEMRIKYFMNRTSEDAISDTEFQRTIHMHGPGGRTALAATHDAKGWDKHCGPAMQALAEEIVKRAASMSPEAQDFAATYLRMFDNQRQEYLGQMIDSGAFYQVFEGVLSELYQRSCLQSGSLLTSVYGSFIHYCLMLYIRSLTSWEAVEARLRSTCVCHLSAPKRCNMHLPDFVDTTRPLLPVDDWRLSGDDIVISHASSGDNSMEENLDAAARLAATYALLSSCGVTSSIDASFSKSIMLQRIQTVFGACKRKRETVTIEQRGNPRPPIVHAKVLQESCMSGMSTKHVLHLVTSWLGSVTSGGPKMAFGQRIPVAALLKPTLSQDGAIVEHGFPLLTTLTSSRLAMQLPLFTPKGLCNVRPPSDGALVYQAYKFNADRSQAVLHGLDHTVNVSNVLASGQRKHAGANESVLREEFRGSNSPRIIFARGLLMAMKTSPLGKLFMNYTAALEWDGVKGLRESEFITSERKSRSVLLDRGAKLTLSARSVSKQTVHARTWYNITRTATIEGGGVDRVVVPVGTGLFCCRGAVGTVLALAGSYQHREHLFDEPIPHIPSTRLPGETPEELIMLYQDACKAKEHEKLTHQAISSAMGILNHDDLVAAMKVANIRKDVDPSSLAGSYAASLRLPRVGLLQTKLLISDLAKDLKLRENCVAALTESWHAVVYMLVEHCLKLLEIQQQDYPTVDESATAAVSLSIPTLVIV